MDPLAWIKYYKWNKGDDPKAQYLFFRIREFECSRSEPGEPQRIAIPLLDELEEVRREYGAVIYVKSGYRTKEHQEYLRLHGYPTAIGTSQHELGNAADISGANMHRLAIICKRHFSAVGVGKTFIHVDLRADKVRHWTYDEEA